jgi:hypothetical protein
MGVAFKRLTAGDPNTDTGRTRNGDKKMNGLIQTPNLGDIGSFGSLAVAFAGVAAVLYMLFTGVPAA